MQLHQAKESIDTQFEFTTPNGEVETLTPQEIVVIGKAMSKGEDSMVTPMGGLHSYYDISDDKINSFVDILLSTLQNCCRATTNISLYNSSAAV